jgi:hypothetical protein
MTASRWAQPPVPPLTIGEVNQRLLDLSDELARQQPELESLLGELQRVTLAYELHYAAAIVASEAKSEDRRKAEATIELAGTYLDDDSERDVATRRAVLEMQVRAQREFCHNLRAELNAHQTLSANLRAEATLGGMGRT